MSFALYTPKSVGAQELARELGQIIGGRDSPLAGIVRLVPIERMNAVLAISPQARYLDEIKAWVERLDRPSEKVDKRLYVYYVQNGRAGDLASVVIRAVGGSSAGPAPPRVTAPGEGPEVLLQPPPGAAAPPAQPEFARPMTATPGAGGMQPLAPSPPTLSPAPGPGGVGGAVNIAGLGDVTITADEINNALVILATPAEYSVIESALRQLDRVPLQVLLEAAVAEVTLTNELNFGVQYFFRSGKNQAILSNTSTAAITPPLPGFAYVFSQGAGIQVILNALQTVTHVDVLSAPEVLVLNNQAATLQVGDEVPIATTQAVSVLTPGAPIVNSIQFRDTGIILKVTPRVNRGGMVMMDIDQEVSDVAATTTSALNSPTITQRRISSTVAVHDGETIALGGLIKDSRTVTKNGIPLLQDIPVVGSLFKSSDDQRTRTELLVLITPHVVESLEQARSVTEELRRKLPATAPVVERGQ